MQFGIAMGKKMQIKEYMPLHKSAAEQLNFIDLLTLTELKVRKMFMCA